MNILRQSIGVDVSKNDFKTCFGYMSETFEPIFFFSSTYENNSKGIKRFIKDIGSQTNSIIDIQVVMEATGVYHELLAHTIFESKYKVSIILPNKAKAFIKSINQRAKTDKIDAKILCQMGLERKLQQWSPAEPVYAELKVLTREKESLSKEKSIIKNKIHALKTSYCKAKSSLKRLNKRLVLIQKQIEEIESEVMNIIESNTKINEKVKKIEKIKGISVMTVATVIAETNGFNLIRNQKQLIGYSGLDVVIKQSGVKMNRGRISKKGNSHIRKALFMPALSAIRTNDPCKVQYEELNKRQTAKKQGVIAIAKKLLIVIYALWKNEQEYDENKIFKKNLVFITV